MDDIKSMGEPSPVARRVGTSLLQFGRYTEMMKNYAAKQLGLHPSDLSCLGYMFSAGKPVSPKQIITHLEMSSGTGTALIDRLEAAGYIKRVPNPDDRRGVLIVLDKERAERPLSFFRVIRARYARALSTRSDSQLNDFAALLDELSNAAFDEQLKGLGLDQTGETAET